MVIEHDTRSVTSAPDKILEIGHFSPLVDPLNDIPGKLASAKFVVIDTQVNQPFLSPTRAKIDVARFSPKNLTSLSFGPKPIWFYDGAKVDKIPNVRELENLSQSVPNLVEIGWWENNPLLRFVVSLGTNATPPVDKGPGLSFWSYQSDQKHDPLFWRLISTVDSLANVSVAFNNS